jgi:large subunit ribosomal protein L3
MNAIYGRKVGMTRIFDSNGESVPVTVIELPPNVVYQVKTSEKDGYMAVQVGFGSQKPQRVNKPLTKHFAAAKKGFPRFVAEIRTDKYLVGKGLAVGDELSVDGLFEVGSRVDVSGYSIGKGFAGVMKRHHMKGSQTMSHGTHEYFRHAGSIGCRKFPGRVFKNKQMPGHLGNEKVLQEGLQVVSVRPEERLLLVKGSIPGPKNGSVFVRNSLRCQ